jgi:hypothetical protein
MRREIMSYKLADGSLSTDYKLGDLFIYVDPRGVDHGTFRSGSVVELLTEDGTDCPLFGLVRGECFNDTNEHGIVETSYASWEKLTRYSRTSVAKEQDPDVVIKQSEVDAYIDEINMLRELVAEITLETDYTALGQQASTYRALNEKMSNHQSYKQGDGWSTRESELLEQLDVLFEAYDNVVYTEKEQTFKPISEMTLEDWQQAMEEGWEFEKRDGDVISAMTLSSISNSYPVICNNTLAYTIRGYFWDSGKEHDADIIKRVK